MLLHESFKEFKKNIGRTLTLTNIDYWQRTGDSIRRPFGYGVRHQKSIILLDSSLRFRDILQDNPILKGKMGNPLSFRWVAYDLLWDEFLFHSFGTRLGFLDDLRLLRLEKIFHELLEVLVRENFHREIYF